MNLKQLVKQKREEYPQKMPILKRIKIGRMIGVYASLPLLSVWAYVIAIPMMMAISPTVWIKGRINTFKGNGDLQYG